MNYKQIKKDPTDGIFIPVLSDFFIIKFYTSEIIFQKQPP